MHLIRGMTGLRISAVWSDVTEQLSQSAFMQFECGDFARNHRKDAGIVEQHAISVSLQRKSDSGELFVEE